MIKIKITKEKEEYREISICGHAMYNTFGKDIVCAAVSSLVITTINNIISLSNNAIKVDQKQDILRIIVQKNNEISTKLLNNMLNSLTQIEKDYPKNIKIIM